MRSTSKYAAMTKDEVQHRRWTFNEAANLVINQYLDYPNELNAFCVFLFVIFLAGMFDRIVSKIEAEYKHKPDVQKSPRVLNRISRNMA